MRYFNGKWFKLILLTMITQTTLQTTQVITIEQRPIILLHGYGSACTNRFYKDFVEATNAICIETGAGSESLNRFSVLSQRGCHLLQILYDKNPSKFKNGIYVFAVSNGGILTRFMLELCPLFSRLAKRVMMYGTPNLGTIAMKASLAMKVKGLIYAKSSISKFIRLSLTRAEQRFIDLPMNIDEHNEYRLIKYLAGIETKNNFANIKKLDLWVNVISTHDEIVHHESSLMGASYCTNNHTLMSFSDSEAYKLNYLGLNDMYRAGKYMNCVVEGVHAEFQDNKQRTALLEYFNDNCVFDPVVFGNVSTDDLYEICMKLKILNSPKMKMFLCDPSPSQLYINPMFMSKIKKYSLKTGLVKNL